MNSQAVGEVRMRQSHNMGQSHIHGENEHQSYASRPSQAVGARQSQILIVNGNQKSQLEIGQELTRFEFNSSANDI
jgi:hypothetical protein